MTIGTELGGRLADRSVVRSIYLGLGSTALVLAAFPFTAGGVVSAGVSVLLIAVTGSLCLPALQTRLMDVAGNAQTLAAAGQHAALNVANALGAWLGGLVIAAGLGYRAPALVGIALSVLGFLVVVLSAVVHRRNTPSTHAGQIDTSV